MILVCLLLFLAIGASMLLSVIHTRHEIENWKQLLTSIVMGITSVGLIGFCLYSLYVIMSMG